MGNSRKLKDNKQLLLASRSLKSPMHDLPPHAPTLRPEELPNSKQILDEIHQKLDLLCAAAAPQALPVAEPRVSVQEVRKPGLELDEIRALLTQLDQDTPFTASQLRICEAYGFTIRKDHCKLPQRRWTSPSVTKPKVSKKPKGRDPIERWLPMSVNPYIELNFRLVPLRLPTSLRLQSVSQVPL